MSFAVAPNGTYGRPQPRNVGIWRLVSRYLLRQAQSKRPARFRGAAVLALTTIGARSGLERGPVPVGCLRDGDTWIITATAAGARNHPAWYFNIAAHPDRVIIVVDGERIPVGAAQLEGAELASVTENVIGKVSRMNLRVLARYRAATDREFPVIRLSRLST